MAKLTFVCGTMYSSKSDNLIDRAKVRIVQGKTVLLFTTEKDDRAKKLETEDTKSFITTRHNQKDGCVYMQEAFIIERVDFYKMAEDEKPDSLYLDEAHFVDIEIIHKLADIADILDIPVFCYGLKNDSNIHLFPASELLINIADDIIWIETACCFCKEDAFLNLRTKITDINKLENIQKHIPVFGGQQIQTETENIRFFQVCRRCYRKIERQHNAYHNIAIIDFKIIEIGPQLELIV